MLRLELEPGKTVQHVQQALLEGDVEAAMRQLDRLLQERPVLAEDPYWLACRGQALLLKGENALAVDVLVQAVRLQPGVSAWHCNLGEGYRRLGQLEAARTHLQQALKLQPDYPATEYNLACVAIAARQPQQALDHLQPRLDAPPSAMWLAVAADAWRQLQQLNKARQAYEQALELDQDCAHAHSNLGLMLMHMGEHQAALTHCRRACELRPEQGMFRFNLGQCHMLLDHFDEAVDAYADAYERIPEHIPLLRAIVEVWIAMAEWPEAWAWHEELKALDPDAVETRCLEIHLLRESGQLEQALQRAQALLDEHPGHVQAVQELAACEEESGQITDAIARLRACMTSRTEHLPLALQLGQLLEVDGQLDEAERVFRQILKHNPHQPVALAGLASLLRKNLPEIHARTMETLLQRDCPGRRVRAGLHAGLAYWLDGQGRFEQAAEQVEAANAAYWSWRSERGWCYEPEAFSQEVDHWISQFDSAWFEQLAATDTGLEDARPVFVVGMPRSGTTLTEQMLAAHPQVTGVGEAPMAHAGFRHFLQQFGAGQVARALLDRQDAVRAAASRHLQELETLMHRHADPRAQRVVDKMPDNYQLIPWLRALFPRARIIHVRRDVRDVAVSCWMTQFGQLRWAFQLEHLARRIEDYLRLTAHWRENQPDGWLEVDYEQLVQAPETTLERMLDWLGLDFAPACLSFHNQRNRVRTASITQVRQPLYRTSVQRWKRYDTALGESLFRRLEAAMQRHGAPASRETCCH